jgi:CheY-like chemotaxis protein
MSINVVLAIGFDPWLFEAQRTLWRSAGFFVTSARSIPEAIDHIKGGDFDLVLLGRSMPQENRVRLTTLIRGTGSRIPVLSIADSWASGAFASSSLKDDPKDLLQSVGRVLANCERWPTALAS